MPLTSKADSSAPSRCPASPLSPSDPRHSCELPPSPGFPPQPQPRAQSPALSIFERSVQEDIVPPQSSPSIPSHIRTENHIPPVLEASSAAITDDHPGPEPVEIITPPHTHPQQPATADAPAPQLLSSSWPGDTSSPGGDAGKGVPPTNGAADNADVRRLSFISFADVINAENAETAEHNTSTSPNRDSFHAPAGTLWRNSGAMGMAPHQNRSPSPLQSPTFSGDLGMSPATSTSASFKGLETSLHRSGRDAGSPPPTAASPLSLNAGGDVDTEAARQMLKGARNRDMSSGRSHASSPAGNGQVRDGSVQ
ncbi:hypothetical protein PHISP_03576 [Aspergillus sp. HF37]|nr:hypothetical protein PHISP_03576 [Aspergillus sp. HF37]